MRRFLALSLLLVLLLGGTISCVHAFRNRPCVTESPVGMALRLRAQVERLCSVPRYGETLRAAQEDIVRRLGEAGWQVVFQEFEQDGETFRNIIATREGTSGKRYIVGAHYDACDCGEDGANPGADDNASAVAVLLELAHSLPRETPRHTLELVFYACEEPPWFGTEDMGSARHAATCRAEDVLGMICLEMLGYYCEEEGSQPPLFPGSSLLLPTKGDFVAVVGDWASIPLARKTHAALAQTMPALRLNLPFAHDTALYFSDHRNYHPRGIPAVMVTDTAMLRNANYHTSGDTPDSLDYPRMARVAAALVSLIRDLAFASKHIAAIHAGVPPRTDSAQLRRAQSSVCSVRNIQN